MISRDTVDSGAILFVLVACCISWAFGAMCGAAAMIGLDEHRDPVRDNRPAGSGAIPKPL